MIVITGTGRSGTSLVAQLYRELGFDPGGFWIPEYNAGYEEKDIVRLNALIIRDLGLTVLADRAVNETVRREVNHPDDPPHGKLTSWLSNAIEYVALRCLGRRAELLDLVPWERFDGVVDKYRSEMTDIAARLPIAKDPYFSWTLGAWAAAGAHIDHVLVCVRHIDAVVESRIAARQVMFRTRSGAKNAFIYGLGLCMTAIYDYRLPHALVRFPDFLDEPERLFEAMRFPAPVTFDRFRDAFSRTVSANMIHDNR